MQIYGPDNGHSSLKSTSHGEDYRSSTLGAQHPCHGPLDVRLTELLTVELLPEPAELLHREEAGVQGRLGPHGPNPLPQQFYHSKQLNYLNNR